MSGHSKWSQIKRQKGINDQKKGAIFSKMSKIITMAVREGGGIADPAKNFKLRLAVERARAENMPKDNIERAIEKATGADSANIKEVVYEGFAVAGASLIITAATDNPNRTFNMIKSTLEKLNGKMGSPNSVAYNYDKCGVVVFNKSEIDEAAAFSFSDSIGASDIDDNGSTYVVYIPFEKLGHVHEVLGDTKPDTIDVFYRPHLTVMVDHNIAEQIGRICEALEDLDDVDKVYSNYETED